MARYPEVLLVVFGFVLSMIEGGLALRCWKCTSNTDATCRDYFNTTRILLNQRVMDSYNYGSVQSARNDPHLAECEGMHTSTYAQFKNVCLKRVITGQNSLLSEIHRECRMVPKDLKMGACPDDFVHNRPRNLEFCGTCEYDGCNSANANSIIFMGLVPSVLLLLRK